eukprot:COSAG05_NODE_1297_length_5246_cov_2.847873_3_plen_95_part_00
MFIFALRWCVFWCVCACLCAVHLEVTSSSESMDLITEDGPNSTPLSIEDDNTTEDGQSPNRRMHCSRSVLCLCSVCLCARLSLCLLADCCTLCT